ncbi:MAG TPA: protein kinase [Gemmatimonadaceae bacterium]|nr:protein kinase [Gemmatimonadaceae bacterium]
MPSVASPELLVLQEVVAGRYSIEHELGRGGMGIVFLARDVALERPVAIKLLPPHLAADERMRARFVREARTAARLSHPNIVPIHSVEEHDDVVFFVMGYVDGETLTARVRRTGPLSASDGSRLIQEIAWALAYAHTAGVIHRDVKPDNVLIERATGRAMLTDFGIARVADGSSATGLGEILGTAQFVSPEQASGSVVDGRSDLYSLGVTAFFALTGRLPFEAPTAIGLLGMHLTQPPPPIATVRESLPPGLCVAIDRCLAKDPADRFATGEQLADAIADARGAEVQVAPAVRAFLRDRTRAGAELALLYFAAMYLSAFAHLPLGRVAGPLALLGIASVARLFRTGRRLVSSGYGFEDVRTALQAESASRREELGIAHLTAADETRLRTAALTRAFGIVSTLMGVGTVIPSLLRGRTTAALLGGAGIVVGLFLMRRAGPMPPRQQRRGQLGRWFDQLWQGRMGEWFFRAVESPLPSLFTRSGSRPAVERPALANVALAPAVGTHTEVLLARAADDLFDSLPSSVRAQLGPGIEIVERLRDHITALREREEQLAGALAQAGELRATAAPGTAGSAAQSLIDRGAELVNDLERARDDVAGRRAAAVAALENIRLQLLRLRTGLASPADLTADLDAARDLERHISAIVEVNDISP